MTPKPSVLGKPTPFSDSLKRKSFKATKSVTKTNVSEGLSKPVTTQTLPQTTSQPVKNTNVVKPGMYRFDTRTTQTRASQLPHTFKNTNPRVSTPTGVIHNTSVSRPQLRSTQMKEKVMHNNSQVKFRKTEIVQLILFIIESGCTKHMTGNLKLLCNFVEKYLASPTQAWLWHQRLSHLNFDSINLLSKKDIVNGLPNLKYAKDQLCSSCELSKAKRSTFKTKTVPSSKGRLKLLHMDLCGPMRIESINGKKYILVIVDDYSRYTWTLFLRTMDETPEKNALNIELPLLEYEQNSVVKRRNRTLVEAARMMLSAFKLPLFFWAEAIATACYT
ncbi:retrovirus-related pol polyprotein from transposon TNT 1-94 [Tanacetum coccineum]